MDKPETGYCGYCYRVVEDYRPEYCPGCGREEQWLIVTDDHSTAENNAAYRKAEADRALAVKARIIGDQMRSSGEDSVVNGKLGGK